MSTAAFRKPPAIGHRFADFKAESYDAKARTFEAVLSTGAAVKRGYGLEKLLTTGAKLDRLSTCGIPLIDSHNIFSVGSVFGKMVRGWLNGGSLMALLALDDSTSGKMAEGLIARGMVRGISIGYRVDDDDWEVTDADGNVVPQKSAEV
jgi:Caudovirus prohead serine protease